MLGHNASARKEQGSPISPSKKATVMNLTKSPSKLDIDREELQAIKTNIDAKVKRMKTLARQNTNESPQIIKP